MWSGLGDSKFLAVVDPIFGVTFGRLMLAVGMAEIVIALVGFFGKWQAFTFGTIQALRVSRQIGYLIQTQTTNHRLKMQFAQKFCSRIYGKGFERLTIL